MSNLNAILHDFCMAPGFCIDGLNRLVQAGFDGKINLGGKSSCISSGSVVECADRYFLLEGKVLGSFNGKKSLLAFPKHEQREVSPDAIPFANYSPLELTRITVDIYRALEQANLLPAEPVQGKTF